VNDNTEIKKLLQKFVLNQCSQEESAKVLQYCKDNELTNDFPTVEEIQQLLIEMPEMEASDADRIFSNILATAKEAKTISSKERKNGWKRYTAIAASFVVLLTIGWFYQYGNNSQQRQVPVLTGNEITLQLANGEVQVLSENSDIQLKDAEGNIVANQNKGKIVYDTETAPEDLVYNTLKIPYGKRFELVLSDGTNVHLNSGTTLKYPVKFIAGQNRTVFLDGEAFFDVTKDKKHPFVVNADALNVRVLGTHFNVSNYPEDDITDVVLVEGSVGLHTSGEKFDATRNTVLEPGYRGSFTKANSKITTKAVSTQIYTAWIKGELVFRNMSFKNICKKLERHYNITIINQNKKLENEIFNASFKNEPIEKVLGYFNELHGLKYTIAKDKIIIK
jgi:ferric-dicitrate binding protein FerR (iron transport regulator)